MGVDIHIFITMKTEDNYYDWITMYDNDNKIIEPYDGRNYFLFEYLKNETPSKIFHDEDIIYFNKNIQKKYRESFMSGEYTGCYGARIINLADLKLDYFNYKKNKDKDKDFDEYEEYKQFKKNYKNFIKRLENYIDFSLCNKHLYYSKSDFYILYWFDN